MTSGRIYVDYLRDMVESAEKALDFVQGMTQDEFIDDEKTTYAVIRALEVLGEAAKKIPDEVRGEHPDIPWRTIAGMRDKLIHEYFGVDRVVIWRTVTEDIPGLLPKLHTMLDE